MILIRQSQVADVAIGRKGKLKMGLTEKLVISVMNTVSN